MIRKYIEKIGEEKNVHYMEKLGDMLSEILYDMKESHRELYEEYKMELYEMAYGKKISDDMAEKWVESMVPIGKYWNIEQTTSAMNSMGYNHDRIDFYVVANMMKNDYVDLVENDDTLALRLAHDWLDDDDATEHKLYCYWKHIVKHKTK